MTDNPFASPETLPCSNTHSSTQLLTSRVCLALAIVGLQTVSVAILVVYSVGRCFFFDDPAPFSTETIFTFIIPAIFITLFVLELFFLPSAGWRWTFALIAIPITALAWAFSLWLNVMTEFAKM